MWKSEPIWDRTEMNINIESKHILQTKQQKTWEQKVSWSQQFCLSFINHRCVLFFFINHHSKLFFYRTKLFPPCPSRQSLTVSSCNCVPFPQTGPTVVIVSAHELNEAHIKFQGKSTQMSVGGCHSLPLWLSTSFCLCLDHKMMHTLTLGSRGSVRMK